MDKKPDQNVIYLTSSQSCKIEAVRIISQCIVESVPDCKSGVPEQPVGRDQTRQGALNRMADCYKLPIISIESGLVGDKDISIVILKTRLGFFESWTEKIPHNATKLEQWRLLKSQDTTVGSFYNNPKDWYRETSGKGRTFVIANAIQHVLYEWQSHRDLIKPIPAPSIQYKGVPFLDIQVSLMENSQALVDAVKTLSKRLLFNKVMLMDARGFLFAGIFAGYPIVLARKPGKLPTEELSVTYSKEYGTDNLCISKGIISVGDRVLVIDDLVATGGTLGAAKRLIMGSGGECVGLIAPYALVKDDEPLCKDPLLRFAFTMEEATGSVVERPRIYPIQIGPLYICPPSMRAMVPYEVAPIKWGKFSRSSNIQLPVGVFEGRDVKVMMDPSNVPESWDVLHILSILYRKKPASVEVVIPFLEQATQDRVEFKQDYESIAMVDTINKLLGHVSVRTFDLHAEQSRLVFHDLTYTSLVNELWVKFHEENPDTIPVFPDEGAKKRFSSMLNESKSMTFRKVRRGDQRIIATDDQVEAGRDYVIIDDLVRSGGTMKAVATYLSHHNALSVSALFAHAPLERTAGSNLSIMKSIWTTNTCHEQVPANWVKQYFM